MKKLLLAFSLSFISLVLFAQTNINGVINDYARVTAIDAGCTNTLTLDASQSANFNVGDTILIIQMQGAFINGLNNALFGDVTNLNAAGNYEKNYITAKAGNDVTLGFDLVH